MGEDAQHQRYGPAAASPDARLRAVVELAQAMAAAQVPMDAVRVAAARARDALAASMAAVSVWDRESGRLRVLVNDGDLAPGEEPEPEDESYPVADFPEIVDVLDERRPGGGLPRAWVQRADDPVDERTGEEGRRTGTPLARERVLALRRRGRGSCLVAPIVLHGRAWGELHLARPAGAAVFGEGDSDFATLVAAQISAGLAQTERLADLRRLAFTDPLTGLANRRAVDTGLDRALERHRCDGTVVSLIVCDLNGLKRVNDERGHEVGDRLLERFAGQLSLCGASLPGSMAARLGGDEFCLLVEGHKADDVVTVAEEICNRALSLGEGEGVSCGVASTGDPIGPVTTPDRLLRLADAAQYRAKAGSPARPVVAGRGRTPDLTVELADAAVEDGAAARGTPGRRGDRRRFRGGHAGVDPGRLLVVVLSGLDRQWPERAAHPADTLGRLVMVAESTCRMLDAAAWWIGYVPPGSGALRTVRHRVHRGTRGGPAAGARPAPDEVPDTVVDLRAHPLTARAVRGDWFSLRAGVPGNDPAEDAVLVAGGYHGIVAAGGGNPAGGWLVEVLGDRDTLPLAGAGPVLRALVAVALSGPASTPG